MLRREEKKRLPERAAQIERKQMIPLDLGVETCARRTAEASGGALSAGASISSRYRHKATKGAAKCSTEAPAATRHEANDELESLYYLPRIDCIAAVLTGQTTCLNKLEVLGIRG